MFRRVELFLIVGLSMFLGFAVTVPASEDTPPGVALPGPQVVGTARPIEVTPDLSTAVESAGRLRWVERIEVDDAAFLKPHFVNLNLRHGDRLVVRSASGEVIEELTLRGPKRMGSFWGLSAFGKALELELDFAEPYGELPFRIDQVIVGDRAMLAAATGHDGPESICTPRDFEDVFCYQGDSGKWASIFASVGVMSVGGNPTSALFCSGSNISPSNHVLTNQHCVENQSVCNNTEFVFKYYRTGCNNGSPTTPDWEGFRCDTQVESSPFISCDQGLNDLDFSLHTVIGDPAATYGFVTPDPTPLTSGEDIYIVQHPAGRPHEITHGGGANVEVDGTVLRYYDTLDTEGGSSGSPIFREADDKLIGLHHCGGCSTPGTGNRGMLMSDIYPLIEQHLCASSVDLLPIAFTDLQEVAGDGDPYVELGETWQFTPQIRNNACSDDALNVSADIQVNAASTMPINLLDTIADFGTVAAGTSAAATAPVRFEVSAGAACGADVVLDLVNITASSGGPFDDELAYFTSPLGEIVNTIFFTEDFSGGLGSWTVIDGGAGAGPASTWTDANPAGRPLSLTAPFAIVDARFHGGGNAMDEELISPVIDASGAVQLELQFAHDFRWYTAGSDEQADVDVRSTATGGSWVNVARFQNAGASGVESVDITAQAAADLEIRFRYHNANTEWFWAVDDIFVLKSDLICVDMPEIFADGFESGDTSMWSGVVR